MKIIRINGTQIVLKDKNNVQQRRNSSHVKLYRESSGPEEEIQSDHKTGGETEPQETRNPAEQHERKSSAKISKEKKSTRLFQILNCR